MSRNCSEYFDLYVELEHFDFLVELEHLSTGLWFNNFYYFVKIDL